MNSVLTVLVVLGLIGAPIAAGVFWLMHSKHVQQRKEYAVFKMQQLYGPGARPERSTPMHAVGANAGRPAGVAFGPAFYDTEPRLQVPALSMIREHRKAS